MAVKTTINMHKRIMEKINNASNESGKSRSEIIVHLLMKVMSKETMKAAAAGPVKYQDKGSKDKWHKFHISLQEDEYEYFIDLRKVLKSSVSRLVAHAVEKYLDEIIYGEISDISLFKNYIISRESANGVIFWKILWGVPKNVEKFIQLN